MCPLIEDLKNLLVHFVIYTIVLFYECFFIVAIFSLNTFEMVDCSNVTSLQALRDEKSSC